MDIFVALGGNKVSLGGGPSSTIRKALMSLADHRIALQAVSRFFSTPAFPEGSGADYVNGVVSISTSLPCEELLAALHSVEQAFGRTRDERWGARTLDLDLLAYGDRIAPDRATYDRWANLPAADQRRLAPSELILPHPRLQDRAFVLVPWADLAPRWRHPVPGLTVAGMIARLPPADVAAVRPF